MMKNTRELLDTIAQAIYDKKGFNILALDVSEVSSLTNYFVIAEGNIDRHVVAIAQAISRELSAYGEKPIRMDGDKTGEWVVIDYGNILVHLFKPDMRQRYALEELWKDGSIVDVDIDVSASEPVQVDGRL